MATSNANEKITEYLSASPSERLTLLPTFLKSLRDYLNTNITGAIRFFRQVYDPSADFSQQQAFYATYKKFRTAIGESIPPSFLPLRIAILGSGTLTQLRWLVELNLFCSGFLPEIYAGDYSTFRQEILNPASGLYEFSPDVVFLLTNHRDIQSTDFHVSREALQSRVESEYKQLLTLWNRIHDSTDAIIIQNNFDIPDIRLFGNIETLIPGSMGSLLQQLNHYIATHLPEYVALHDLDFLSSYHGKKHFYDPRFYFHSKQVCSFEILPAYASSLASIIRAQYGKMSKCLVLDLDNTLWGGVIGDDGIDGIVIGEGSPQGEAYLAFQHYIKKLKERGVILAVCSKNNLETAREPFLKHPDMVLRLEDIACFVANWNPKPDNLAYIAKHLNIGIDSLVFVDDNPAERAIVRQTLPEVFVPELPEDPAMYIRVLNEIRHFEPITFSEEDSHRTRYYFENNQRQTLADQVTNLDDFLSSLEMVADIKPFNDIDLDRIAQLVSRSNQFNLTTPRYTRSELQELSTNPNYLTLSVRLRDKFGDNGLIGVWIGKIDNAILEIDTWLMSCRVLERGVENHLLKHIVCKALENQLNVIKGVYIPTNKNKLVEQHYARLGFTKASESATGITEWELNLSTDPILSNSFIKDH